MNKRLIIIIIIACILFVGCLITGLIGIYKHNSNVDLLADECMELINEATMDLAQEPIDNNQIFSNVVLISVVINTKINEDALTYFGGNKSRYNEIYDASCKLINMYRDYFNSHNQNIFNGADVSIETASIEELTFAYNQLVSLSSEIDNTLNSTIWDKDEAWSMLWGDNPDEAKANYTEFKTKVDQKIEQLKARIDTINTNNDSSNNSSSFKSNNNQNYDSGGYSSSKNYSDRNSGGYSGGGRSTDDDRRDAGDKWFKHMKEYQQYVQQCRNAGIQPLSFESWCTIKGY